MMSRSVGVVGKGIFKSKANGKATKVYNAWNSMLNRCYSEKYHKKFPSYIGCTVHPEWHNFQVFAEWYEENYVEGWDLDKDILVKGNKIYSPETCCFVPKEINYLFTKSEKTRGEYPIGVSKHRNRFEVKLSVGSGNRIFIGSFGTPEEAFEGYKQAKEGYIKGVADKWHSKIDYRLYCVMYEYQVEMAD